MRAAVTADVLTRLAPFGSLRPEVLTQMMALARHEYLERKLRDAPYFWKQEVVYLLRGELKLGLPNGSTRVLVGGCGPALAPLVNGGMTPEHVRPITDVELLCFEEKAFDILVTLDQLLPAKHFAAGVSSSVSAVQWDEMPGVFDVQRLTSSIFASLPSAHIESLLSCFERQKVGAGEVIVRQNDPGDYYYVIERGRAEVSRSVAGVSIELADLKSGDAFGEEALIAETSRNATVRMKTDGILLRLDRADFNRLLREPLLHRLDPADAAARIGAGAIWLDVRFSAEYRHDGFPGALNIPLNELRDTLPNLPHDKEYVVYCQSGRRSSAAAFLMSQRGFRASLLTGGMRAMNSPEPIAS